MIEDHASGAGRTLINCGDEVRHEASQPQDDCQSGY
jgi:hypothetical protein